MQILTSTGYVDIEKAKIGDNVVYYDRKSGEKKTNRIVSVDKWDKEYTENRIMGGDTYTATIFDGEKEVKVYNIPKADIEGGGEVCKTLKASLLLKESDIEDKREVLLEQDVVSDTFDFYLINGTYKLFKYELIWTHRLIHVEELQIGDTIYDDHNKPITITSLEKQSGGVDDVFWRLRVDGNHNYIANGLSLHNGTIYWVAGGSSANWNATGSTNWGSASGTRDNASVPGSADDVIFDDSANGNNPSTISASITINSLVFNGGAGWANTLTHNASVILTIDGQNGSGNSLIMVAGMTYTPIMSTSRITFTGGGTNKITSGGKVFPMVYFGDGGGTHQLQDDLTIGGISSASIRLLNSYFDPNGHNVTFNGFSQVIYGAFTFYDLTRTGPDTLMTGALKLRSDITVTHSLAFNGSSGTNRDSIVSYTVGTASTITYNGTGAPTASNVDFQDITAAGTYGAWDFSGSTSVGQLPGNTNITCTTAIDLWWKIDTSGSHSDSTMYFDDNANTAFTTRRVPLPQDTLKFDNVTFTNNTARTITLDSPRMGKINASAMSRTGKIFNGTTAVYIYGDFLPGSIYGTLSNLNLTFVNRSSQTIAAYGSQHYITINSPGGTVTLSGALTIASTSGRGLSLTAGTFSDAGYNVSACFFQSTGTEVRSLNKTSTWTIGHNSGVGWKLNSTNFTWAGAGVDGGSIIILYFASGNQSFDGGDLTYNNLTYQGAGNTYYLTISGSNTFNVFTISNAPKKVQFGAGYTTTVATLTLSDADAGHKVTLASFTPSSWWKITKAGGGQMLLNYVDVTDSKGDPASTWFYGAGGSGDAYSQANGWAAAPAADGNRRRRLLIAA